MGKKIKAEGDVERKIKSGLDQIQIREWDSLVKIRACALWCTHGAEQFHSTTLQVVQNTLSWFNFFSFSARFFLR
jgi:hypothetical protein